MPLKWGGLRPGQWYLGINRRRTVVDPTRYMMAVVQSGRCVAWDTPSSGAPCGWEFAPAREPAHMVHRRPILRSVTRQSRAFARVFLGCDTHAGNLVEGMAHTAARRKAAVEAR